MKLIGLIGGIASGKSYVATMFQQLGAKIIDADLLAHQVLVEPETVAVLRQRWGDQILRNGELDRRQIAKIVFADSAKSRQELDWLESHLHPQIKQRVDAQLAVWRQDPTVHAVILDAPVLIKAGWHLFCDELIFVDATLETRLARAQKRGWDAQELQRRESFQTSLEQKRSLATYTMVSEDSGAVLGQESGDSEFSGQESASIHEQVSNFWRTRVQEIPDT